MQDYIVSHILSFFQNKKKVFWFGFLIAIVATSLELLRGRAENYHVFADSTLYFWKGINPYTQAFVEEHHRFFLYTPVFSVLFTPIALLPDYIGGFVWNLANYTLMFFAVDRLPKQIAAPKLKLFLYILPLLEQSIFPFQYNIVVCYIFLYAFTLLEKDKGIWAVLLIMISATTKIYGIFELALLFCYKHTLRNFMYAALFGGLLLLSPVVAKGFDGLLPYYNDWWNILQSHNTTDSFVSLVHLPIIRPLLIQHSGEVQMGTLAILAILFFAMWKRWGEFGFRCKMLGILLGWIILFSDASEFHTYIIAFSGFLLFYYTKQKITKLDDFIYWTNFVLFGIMPIDLLCPVSIHKFVHGTLWLDVLFFTFTWLYMIFITLTCQKTTNNEYLELNKKRN